MRALAVKHDVPVTDVVLLDARVGETVCVVAVVFVTLMLDEPVEHDDGDVVRVPIELGAARLETLDVADADRVFVKTVEPEPVRDTGGVAVILMEAEVVTDAVVVLLPGRLLVYVGEVDAVLVVCGVLVVVLDPIDVRVVVEEPDLVFVAVTVLLPLGDAVPVLELAIETVPVGVLRMVTVGLVELEREGDALEVFDACIDRVIEADVV